MSTLDFLNKIVLGDCLDLFKKLDDASIDLVLTDPPYFLDKLDESWKPEQVLSKKNQYAIKSLPAGMKFSRQQGIDFYKWYRKVSEEVLRVLKPGGFFFSFSSPRLYHRMASAVDDAGFDVRDAFLWIYTQNQAKAMGLDHFIDKLSISSDEKEVLINKLENWKTPQIKSCYEPICVAQKRYEITFLNNIQKYEVGLFNTGIKVGNNMYPSNIMTTDGIDEVMDRYFLVNKPTREEKSEENSHITVKPISLCEHLIKLSAFSKHAIILDPFMGSGTTALAAKNVGVQYIGFELNEEYVAICEKRLVGAETRQTLFKEITE